MTQPTKMEVKTKPIRVLIVYTAGIEKTGSAPTHIKELAKGFQRAGAKVVLFAPLHSCVRPKDIPCRAILVPMFVRHRIMAVLARFMMLLYFPYVLISVRPHLIYERATFIGFILQAFARLLGIKTVTELNGAVGGEWEEHGLPKIACRLGDAITIIKLKHCLRVISVSEDIVSYYLSRYNASPHKFLSFHNGANVNHICPMDKIQCRQKLGLPENEFIYGYIGGFAGWHRTQDIVHAVDKLVRQNQWQGKVMLVGITQRAESTVKLIEQLGLKEYFILVDWVLRDKLPLYFAASDIGIGTFSGQKCRQGFSGIKVFEYLSAGLPVIVSDTTQHRNVIGKHELGYIFPPEDPDALSEAMAQAYRQRGELAAMGARARKYMIENGSWEIISARIWREITTAMEND